VTVSLRRFRRKNRHFVSCNGHAYFDTPVTDDNRMLANDSTAQNRWFYPLALSTLTLFAFTLRWYYVNTAVVIAPLRGDAMQYYEYAWNLAHHWVFAKNVPGAAAITPDNYRDPGYPLFLAVWMKLVGNTGNSWYAGDSWYIAILRCQALLGALTVLLATRLGRYWLSPRWAIVAGLLMAIWPHNITINSDLLSETLFGFLCALSLLLSANAFRRQNPFSAATAGLVLGATALTNAILLPFGILLAGFLALRKLAPFKICMALALGSLLLPGIWAVRNMQISAPVAGSSSKDRVLQNFVQGSWPNFHSAWRASIFGDANTQAKAHAPLQAVEDEIGHLQSSPADGAETIIQRFSTQPFRYVTWYLFEKPYSLWDWSIEIGQGDIYVFPVKNTPFQINPIWLASAAICKALNMSLMLLALASPFCGWSSQRSEARLDLQANRAALAMVIGLLAFVTLVYAALQAEPRYSIPFRSFEMLLSVTTISAATTWWQRSRVPKFST